MFGKLDTELVMELKEGTLIEEIQEGNLIGVTKR